MVFIENSFALPIRIKVIFLEFLQQCLFLTEYSHWAIAQVHWRKEQTELQIQNYDFHQLDLLHTV